GGKLGVEGLAAEDVHRHVVLVGERVDAVVALGDQDETRQAPILGLQAAVLEHVGRHDLGHADARGKLFQDPIDEVQIRQLLTVAPVPIEHEVRPESGHLVSHLHWSRATRGVVSGSPVPSSDYRSESSPPNSSKSSSSRNSSSSRSSSSNSSSSSISSSSSSSTSSPPKTSNSSSSPPFLRFMSTLSSWCTAESVRAPHLGCAMRHSVARCFARTPPSESTRSIRTTPRGSMENAGGSSLCPEQ